MKKLIIILCIICILLLACPIKGDSGDDGKRGKSKTITIEQVREKQTITVFEGIIEPGWNDIDLSFLEVNDFIEMCFINENETKCPETLKVYFQVDDYDIGTLVIENKQSIVFIANNLTKFRWKSLNYGKKLTIIVRYDIIKE